MERHVYVLRKEVRRFQDSRLIRLDFRGVGAVMAGFFPTLGIFSGLIARRLGIGCLPVAFLPMLVPGFL
jgi:hypothetical protein